MSLKSLLKNTLKADGVITANCGARVLDSEDVGQEGLKLEHIKTSSSPIILPSLYLNWMNDNPFELFMFDAHQAFVEIYCYQHSKYDVTGLLRRRVKAILHGNLFTDSGSVYWFFWAGDVLEQKDPELRGANVERSRYEVRYREV